MIAAKTKIGFINFLYQLALLIALPLVLFYFLWRIARDRRYRDGFGERLGTLPFTPLPTPAGAIWLHAISVGEVLSSIELIKGLRRLYPLAPFYVSCGTVAGRKLAHEKLGALVNGIFYAPLDYRWSVRRVLRCLRPSLLIVLETEIWPNLYREAKRAGAALAIANGRISDRAFPRYLKLKPLFEIALSRPDVILVQSEKDRKRYLALGAPQERVELGGNLKYDFTPGSGEIPHDIRQFLTRSAPRKIWIAASTMPPFEAGDVDEDDVVIDAFKRILSRDGLLLILVPRKPERFDVAASKLEQAGIPFTRRTALRDSISLPGVLLLDSMGELSRLFAISDVVFMGGSLARRGGHNILEPAFFGKPVIVGPHMENFTAIAEEFLKGGALAPIREACELASAIDKLLESPGEIGDKAARLAASKRGITGQIADRLFSLYLASLPASIRSLWRTGLAKLWEAGVRVSRLRAESRRRKLDRPVVCIGGMTMGGAGKTPMVEWLASRLREAGLTPAVLTRGYRRRSVQKSIILPAGETVAPAITGDEAQIFLRSGAAHVGIGSDRYAMGLLVESLLNPDLFLLDDGFQHWRLIRDVDVIMIDALDPFGGSRVFPAGRLREPLDGLTRASAFVITRVEPGLRTDAIERVLRHYNPIAPILKASVAPESWRNIRTGQRVTSPPFEKVVAFCGLANPETFWRTLESQQINVAYRWSFGDHHRYRPTQIRRLARRAVSMGADALVTTEKDSMNLCDHLDGLLKGVPLWWLKIGLEVEGAEQLLKLTSTLAPRR